MRYVPRRAGFRLRRLLQTFPAVFIYGPRQCGKTTLVRTRYSRWAHFDLERPRDYDILSSDVEGFLAEHPRRVVIDEAQRLPALFPALRYAIDTLKENGRFILLGSAGPSLTRQISESLAGRIGFLELTPFRSVELSGAPARDRWFWGGFPPVHSRHATTRRMEWLDSYVTALLERDIPALGSNLPSVRLRALWTMLTHVHGGLLNVADIARSLAVSTHTVSHYIDVLEAMFMIRRLRPYFANIGKRLTKSAKVYVRDTGLLHHLAGLRHLSELSTWPGRGLSWEGMVVEELVTLAQEVMVGSEVYFWRTQAGGEVDLIIKAGRRLLPFEIRMGRRIPGLEVRGLRQCMEDLSLKRGWVITSGDERLSVGRGVESLPWRDIVEGKVRLEGLLARQA